MTRDEAAPGSQDLKNTAPSPQNLEDTDSAEDSAVEDVIRGSELWQDTRPQYVRPSRSGKHSRTRSKPNLLSGVSPLKLLLAAVFAIASVVGVLVTIEWDGLQKETEFRSTLIGGIQESVTNVIQSGYETAAGVHGIEKRGGPNMARVKQVYHGREDEWKAEASRISGQMEKLVDPQIGRRWEAYSVILSDYLRLSYPLPAKEKTVRHRNDLKFRRQIVHRISAYLESRGQGKTIGPRQRDSLIRRSGELGTHLSYYLKLGGKLSSEAELLIEEIRAAPTKIGPPTGLLQWARERRFGADAHERPARMTLTTAGY